MANCLVLGANGFIGSHLVDKLVRSGHTVRCFDRFKTDDFAFERSSTEKVEIVRGDFMDRKSIERSLENIEYVFHFVSMTTPISVENNPLIDIETNIRMSIELFQLCSQSGVKRIIFASTGGAIYGDVDTSGSISEQTYPLPVSPYAIGKLTIENYLRYFKRKHGLDYRVLRISNPYGPRQNTLSGQGVVSIFLEHAMRNEPITVYGDGSMVRDYLYIEDLVNLIVGSFEKPGKHSVYNVGSGKGSTVNEIITEVEKATGKKVKRENVPKPPTFVDKVVLDTRRFKEDFNLTPGTSLEVGVFETWQALVRKTNL